MGKTAFLFPGQGAQEVGMGQALVEKSSAAKSLFERAEQVLGYDLLDVCVNGPADHLDKTDESQPAIFTTSLAALEVLREESPELVENCQAAAGLSLGEYTALTFAGVFSFEDGLALVKKRGEAMQEAAEATQGGMVCVLGLERDKVVEICDQARDNETLEIANYLGPGNIVVSGNIDACERAAEIAPKLGAMKAVPLAVAGAFHTKLVQPADEKLAEALANTEMKQPRIPVISNVDVKPHTDAEEIRAILVKQILGSVYWEDTMQFFLGDGFDQFYEIGPGRVLRGLLRRINRKISCKNIQG